MSGAIVISTLLREQGPTGVQAHFNAFSDYLRARGETVRLVTPFQQPRLLIYPVFGVRRLIDRMNGAASVCWYRYWHYLFLKQALGSLLKDAKAVTIYAQCPLSAKAALEARRSPAQRVIMIAHFNLSQAEEWADKGRIRRGDTVFNTIQATEHQVLPRLDGIVYVSRFMRGQLQRRISGLDKVESVVIPNFVAEPALDHMHELCADLINIGTLEPRKNQRYLLDVLHHANRLGHRYCLTLVGDGPDRPMLEQMVKQYGLNAQVNFMGARPDAARYIARHRLYVHSATMESFGIVLIEAMAAAVPVMAAPVGGIPEVFSDGCEGGTWPLDDAEAGARRLIDLLEQPERLAQMAAAARQRYLAEYTPDVAASRLLRFLSGRQGEAEAAA